MKIKLICMALLLCAIGGCVAARVDEAPSASFAYADFKSIYYDVHVTPQTEIGDGADGRQYADHATELFKTLLGLKLKEMGYSLAAEPAQADLRVDVPITEAKPGSGAARFWIGMGVGRAVFTFSAIFTAKDARHLGAFQGGRSYTGMEMNQGIFPGRDEIATRAATRGVEQIEQYLRGGGHFPDEPASARKL